MSTTTIGIDIDAPPELVYRLARDVTRWDVLLPHYARSHPVELPSLDGVVGVVVDFVARRPFVPLLGLGIPVTWRARTWHEPDTRRLRFVHVAGATKGMDVTWTIEPAPHATAGGAASTPIARTQVTIAHRFEPRLPGFAGFVDRWFTRPIAGRTLATFKALAEALDRDIGDRPVAAVASAPESTTISSTNPST